MLRLPLLFVSLCSATALAAPAAPKASPKLVVFGDSLSDNGNAFRLTGGMPPAPYFQGRFSNGPVWNEVLNSTVNLPYTLANYAYGGATAGTSIGSLAVGTQKVVVPDIHQQIAAYADQITNDNRGLTGYAIFIGANDYSNQLTVSVDDVISSIQQAAESIISQGGRKILLVGIPPLELTPRITALSAAFPPVKSIMAAQVQSHNDKLVALAANITGAHVQYVDAYGPIVDMVNNPAKYGFENVKEPCLDLAAGKLCADPDKYLFWDALHPTAKGHAAWAAVLSESLSGLNL